MNSAMIALLQSTPTISLAALWDMSLSAVRARKKGEQPLTVKQAGLLAKMHGMNLEHILAL